MQQEQGVITTESFTVLDISLGEKSQVEEPITPNSNDAERTVENSQTEGFSTGEEEEYSEARKFRLLSDVYDETEEIELDEDELMLAGIDEPRNYEQAVTEQGWKEAMQTEIEAIEKNNTWRLEELPAGHKPIKLKWVFKLKRDTNGEIIKHKARLVARGYVQKKGIDFEEAFAPVTRLETVRLLLALAVKNAWEVHHLDVKSAFFNGDLKETAYVLQPEGFVKPGKERLVYRLIKALYGLRQAPRAWYSKLNKCLEELGFSKCPHEHAVYTRREGDEVLIIGVYVDDLLITGTNV